MKKYLIFIFLLFFVSETYATDFPILMYHHIRPGKWKNKIAKDLSCEPDIFINHLNEIRQRGYTTITFKDMMNKRIVSKPIVLTFDDGLSSQWWAFEELTRRNMVGVFFVIVKCVGGKQYLNQNQLRVIAKSGMEIGSHSITHCDLTKVGQHRLEVEVNESKKLLEELVGVKIISFCYPYGRYNKNILNVLYKSEYYYARTTNEWLANVYSGRNFELPIVYIHNYTKELSKWLH